MAAQEGIVDARPAHWSVPVVEFARVVRAIIVGRQTFDARRFIRIPPNCP